MTAGMTGTPLLDVEDLGVNFRSEGRIVEAVKGVSFTLNRGETLSLVGELDPARERAKS